VFNIDFQVERRLRRLPLRPWIGLRVQNALGWDMSLDVQRNVDGPEFGAFYSRQPRRVWLTLRLAL